VEKAHEGICRDQADHWQAGGVSNAVWNDFKEYAMDAKKDVQRLVGHL